MAQSKHSGMEDEELHANEEAPQMRVDHAPYAKGVDRRRNLMLLFWVRTEGIGVL
jgi:hypothetical protein